jgi:GAF domain-containing protein
VNAEERELTERLGEVARALDTGSVFETLQLIVDLAVETVPGCEHAGISLVHARVISTPATTDAVALRLDALQTEVGEGPCLNAIIDERTYRSDDLGAEDRWPAFSPRAVAETGVLSMLGIRLFARARTLGALNLLSTRRHAFDDESLAVAALFAALAAVALNAAQTEESLKLALSSRDVIGQAKGILMERHKISDETAFQRLVAGSQRLNVRLRSVAEDLVATGLEPPR